MVDQPALDPQVSVSRWQRIGRLAESNRNLLVLGGAFLLIILIMVAEIVTPANVVGAYGFVLPLLLIATTGNRRLMWLTLVLCIIATYASLLRPAKPGRFVSAAINRTVVVGVLVGVAYFAITREERKAREEAAQAELATQTENLLRANAQLSELKNELGRAERLAAVGQLVASVAHEVGTPLHSIAWHLQALEEEAALTPDMRKRIDIIDSQIARVVRIIQDLLSSTQQRKPTLARLPVDRLLHPVTALMGPSFLAKGVSFKLEPLADQPMVWGDVEQLQQVLVNLLTNALAATGPGGDVAVLVGRRPATPEERDNRPNGRDADCGEMVTVAVRDTGCGMPAEHLNRAFEPFFTTKAFGTGTGLGLFLSRQVLLAHGGSLTIESEVGKGTTVVLALPGSTGGSLSHDQEVAHGA